MGKIRRMGEEDLDQVLEIENLSFPSPWSRKAFLLEIKNSFSNLFVWEEKRIWGYIIWRSIAGEVHIINIAVHPQRRRKGIAWNLLNFCFEKEKNSEYAILEVRASNSAAIQLYKKIGFVHLTTIRNYYTSPTEDAVVMIKKLNSSDLSVK